MKVRRQLNTLLQRMGYTIERFDRAGGVLYNLHRYRDKSGNFDYEQYRRVQMAGNVRKIEHVFVKEDNIRFLSDYIISTIGQPRFGLCHGTRRGLEQAWFRKYLNCDILGTEISDTATQFEHTIQWDFHKAKDEWIDKFDFIYSNSFDHTYDPCACLNVWMECVRPGGLCIIEHTNFHESAGQEALDPFGARLELMPYLIAEWAHGKFGVRRILQAPDRLGSRSHEIVIQRFEKVDAA